MGKWVFGGMILCLSLIFCSIGVVALLNPSAVYCDALGYTTVVEPTAAGDMVYCLIDGKKVDSWKFLLGNVSTENNYCQKQGYDQTMTDDCYPLLLDSCLACIVNGTKIEVTHLMNLSFFEEICGDGVCDGHENKTFCPEDCSTEEITKIDVDQVSSINLYFLVITLGFIVFIVAVVYFKKSKVKRPKKRSKK
ncbi:hypothetical protein COV93_02405 [Candidatus Woesearchaeota archaeon CG11_big_fil_rev_8_21_14_0_20_43_8]|nr:MAG: hypothetical protein COV93_02405 [Candidatus Woesearchaeota archaeon CG11_big_fil_rev_8_21_14_0_20_43_8]